MLIITVQGRYGENFRLKLVAEYNLFSKKNLRQLSWFGVYMLM